MKNLTTFILAALISVNSYSDNMFLAVKLGYKFNESDKFVTDSGQEYDADYGHWMGTHLRLGYKWDSCLHKWLSCSAGLSHDSQLLSGAPFNDDAEYSKSEVFVEMDINLSDLF